MITLFAIPKAFKGEFREIQLNAIRSWVKLKPRPQIVLFGDEEGIEGVAKKFNLLHVRKIKKSKQGTPLLDDIFTQAEKIGKTPLFVYVNADIVFESGFWETATRVYKQFPHFLLSGQRYEGKKSSATLAPASWADYFIFTKGVFSKMPSFAVGRTFWDKWFFYHALSQNIPLIDATKTIIAVHQTHSYNHDVGGAKAVWDGIEARNNVHVAGGWGNGASLNNAHYITCFKKPYIIERQTGFSDIIFYVRRFFLQIVYKANLFNDMLFRLRFLLKYRLSKKI